MKRKAKPAAVAPTAWVATVGGKGLSRNYRKGQAIFSQGDRADFLFFLERGKVKLTVVSRQGKQAVIALIEPGNFFGEGCLAGQPVRMSTATAMTDSAITPLPKPAMLRALHEDAEFSELFTAYLLSRNIRIEEDLVDQQVPEAGLHRVQRGAGGPQLAAPRRAARLTTWEASTPPTPLARRVAAVALLGSCRRSEQF